MAVFERVAVPTPAPVPCTPCSAPVVGAVNALTALAAATGTPAEALPLVTKWLEVAIKNAYVSLSLRAARVRVCVPTLRDARVTLQHTAIRRSACLLPASLQCVQLVALE
ncbi:MAG: hypothetical protein EOO65_00470 [Methanosarcinales archaeon]|nr:MAG: hypothetical protein EOO65_00470 [Methanosarcinales archaeon]